MGLLLVYGLSNFGAAMHFLPIKPTEMLSRIRLDVFRGYTRYTRIQESKEMLSRKPLNQIFQLSA